MIGQGGNNGFRGAGSGGRGSQLPSAGFPPLTATGTTQQTNEQGLLGSLPSSTDWPQGAGPRRMERPAPGTALRNRLDHLQEGVRR